MVRRWRIGLIRLPMRRLHRGGDQVILEVTTQDVAVLVEGDLFIYGGCKPLCQATMNLSLDNHGVDDRAAVVHGHKAANMHFSGAPVDIHDTNVAAKGIGEIGWVVVVHCLQARLQVRWAMGVGGNSELLDGLASAG